MKRSSKFRVQSLKLIHYLICLILLNGVLVFSFAQQVSVKASVDKNEILIGEPIRLQLKASLPAETDAKWFSLDTIPHFEFISVEKIDTAGKINSTNFSQVLTVTSFDSGKWVIPPLEIMVNGKYYLTDSFPVTVTYSEYDPSQPYHDIKDIIEIQNPYTKYINWTLAALTVISLLAVVYFLCKRFVQPIQPTVPKGMKLAPYDQAVQLLDELKQQQLPEKGQVKLYYTRLNDILRSFLENKMIMTTMQKTNDQLMVQIKDTGLQNDSFIALAQALRMSDAVKFAKYVPETGDNEKSFYDVKSSIHSLNNLGK